jgi:hypothetical protein
MSAPPPPPKPEFADCDETSIQCIWTPDPECSYRLEYKEFPDEWEHAARIEIPKGKGTAEANSVEGLNPTSTYTLRLIAIKDGVESAPGDVLTVDTQGGCGNVGGAWRLGSVAEGRGLNLTFSSCVVCFLCSACGIVAAVAPGCTPKPDSEKKKCVVM